MEKYRAANLQQELANTIEEYIKTHPEMGYLDMDDFVRDAVRDKFDRLNNVQSKPTLPMLEHFNLNETGVKILDRSLAEGTSNGRVVDVLFKPDKVWCDYCQEEDCIHVKFALSLPEAQQILRRQELKIK